MKDEQLENNVANLHGRGRSIRRLSGEFGISRHRVKRILETNTNQRQNRVEYLSKPAKRGSMLDKFKEHFSELIETHKTQPITNSNSAGRCFYITFLQGILECA